MLTRVIVLIGIGLFPYSVSAESLSGKAKLQAKLADLVSFSAQFEQTILDEDEVLDVSTGNLVLQRPNKMRWETVSPEENLIIADGQSIWNIDSFVEQVTVFPQQDTVRNNPIMLLTAQDETAWDKFTVVELAVAPSQMKVEYDTVFEVSALDQDAQISVLKLRFKDDLLVGLKTIDSQQQVSDMTFSAITINKPIAERTFSTDFPAHFTVDDQR
ncbi:outer membrane lipoprotein chaperone LolA [Alteromonas sediminis]|nr:outer membrane lipoprotein chaperone LolA [Alteromonas sediminis]